MKKKCNNNNNAPADPFYTTYSSPSMNHKNGIVVWQQNPSKLNDNTQQQN